MNDVNLADVGVDPYAQSPQTAQGDDWFASNAPAAGATPTAAPGATPGATGGLQGQAAMDSFGQAWQASGGRTTADLKAFADQWNAQNPGSQVTLGGSKGDKVYGPGGQYWADAVIAAGEGGRGASWQTGSGGGGGVALGGFGSLAQGWDQQYKAPSIDEIRAMPGYQFALQEGVKAIDTGAAAKGTVLNGGQKKDILQYATGLADQTAQQKYQNHLGEYMNAYNIFRNNGNDLFDRFNTLAGRGTQAASAATS